MMGATKERGRAVFVAQIAGTECLEKATDITEETPMRRTIALVLAAMLASSMAFAQTSTNSGAGVPGKPGSKSGPAMTKYGPGSANKSGTNPDQSNVKGMPGNKSGPAVKAPSQKD
jgi:hypothetical protein